MHIAVEMLAKEQQPFAFTLWQLLQKRLRGLRPPLPSNLEICKKMRKNQNQ